MTDEAKSHLEAWRQQAVDQGTNWSNRAVFLRLQLGADHAARLAELAAGMLRLFSEDMDQLGKEEHHV